MLFNKKLQDFLSGRAVSVEGFQLSVQEGKVSITLLVSPQKEDDPPAERKNFEIRKNPSDTLGSLEEVFANALTSIPRTNDWKSFLEQAD